MKSIFREYDIRGIFQKELTEESVKKIGYFFGKYVKDRDDSNEETVVAVGYDARTHSPTLQSWLASGLNAAGVKVLNLGLVPTPVSYFAGYEAHFGSEVDATIQITGSHNPPEYNGFKMTVANAPFFGDQIYALGEKVMGSHAAVKGNDEMEYMDAKERYINYIAEQFRHLANLPERFVMDCGNGVAGVVLEEIVAKLGLNVKLLYAEPDGTFPNHHPDPSEEENLHDLKAALASGNYDYGFAYDGDADRLAFLSRENNFKGDVLALFLARQIKNPLVIGEVKCSQVMYDEINKFGRAIMYKTGHSNLKVKIRETGASFAAEVSGHIFFNDRDVSGAGDGGQ